MFREPFLVVEGECDALELLFESADQVGGLLDGSSVGFLLKFTADFPHLHRPEDTIGNVDSRLPSLAVEFAEATIRQLAASR